MTKANECRNFVIAGHAGSGKTTLCELMLSKSGVIPRPGSIEAKNTVSDFMADEQARQAGIYSSCLNCTWKENQFFFTDTPGYGEFIGEYVAAVRAADAALVVLDAVDGPQIGTARAWKLSKERGIPRFGLVNRLDRERADFKATLEQMRKNHGKNVIIPLYWPVGAEANFSRVVNVLFDKEIPAEIADDVAECRGLWLDAIAETDDDLMMRYLDGEELSDDEIREGLKKTVKTGRTIPVFAGSSTKDVGITELMDAIIELFPSPLNYVTVDGAKRKIGDECDAIGIVFKALNDPFSGQLTFVRTVSGTFQADSDVYNLSRPGVKERFGSLLFMNGKNQTPVKSAGPGTIFACAKLKDTHIGDTVAVNAGETPLPGIRYPEPVMSYAVTAAKSGDDEKIAAGLHRIAECDPTVRLERNPETREMLLSGMGDQHLAIISKRLKDQFKVEAVLTVPKVAYRETITSPTLSYLQLADSAMDLASRSEAPGVELQWVLDDIMAFRGSFDEAVDLDGVRNITKTGGTVERLSLMLRLGWQTDRLRQEMRKLLNRLYKTDLNAEPKALQTITTYALEEADVPAPQLLHSVEGLFVV